MKMTLNLQLGMRIRFLREKAKLSQEDLALSCNVNKNYLCDIENGRRNPTIEVLDRIAKGLHIDLSTLLLGVGDKNN